MRQLVFQAIDRLRRDKILMGLVVVAFLVFVVGGLTMDDKSDKAKKESSHAQVAQNSADALTPALAAEFVKWWLASAMDYNAMTAQQSHAKAMTWMTTEAAQSFQQAFWTPQIAQAISQGAMVAQFQPGGVVPQAINPDGSVVVGVSGTLVTQTGGRPVTQQFLASFLIKKDADGLRVAGLDPRTSVVPGSSVY